MKRKFENTGYLQKENSINPEYLLQVFTMFFSDRVCHLFKSGISYFLLYLQCLLSCRLHVKSRVQFCDYSTESFGQTTKVFCYALFLLLFCLLWFANALRPGLNRVRFHYGHPDVFERLFHISRGGISKASKGVNLSEDIFAGNEDTLFLLFSLKLPSNGVT